MIATVKGPVHERLNSDSWPLWPRCRVDSKDRNSIYLFMLTLESGCIPDVGWGVLKLKNGALSLNKVQEVSK